MNTNKTLERRLLSIFSLSWLIYRSMKFYFAMVQILLLLIRKQLANNYQIIDNKLAVLIMNKSQTPAVLSIKNVNIIKKIAVLLTVLASYSFSINLYALELGAEIHKGDESKTTGFNLSLSDNFSRKNNLYWTVAYNNLNDIKVSWNKRDLFFSVNSLEALISHQQKLKSYDSFLKNVVFEYKAGFSLAVTENKFIWEELGQERYFSEKGDINAILAFATHYNISKNSAVKLGIKYQPSFSEFGSVSSIYLGFTYKFGRQIGY